MAVNKRRYNWLYRQMGDFRWYWLLFVVYLPSWLVYAIFTLLSMGFEKCAEGSEWLIVGLLNIWPEKRK